MSGFRAHRLARLSLVVWFLLPVTPLALWAGADRWSAGSSVPQRWGVSGWAAAGAGEAALRSAVLGVSVALITLPAGGLAAWALTFGRLRRGRLVGAILLAPVALPPFAVVMGLNVLLLRARVPAPIGVLLVLSVAAMPYVIFPLWTAYGAYDVAVEDQARMLGAHPAAVVRIIRLPILAPALATATLLAFLVGWSDYIVTLLIGGGQFVTLPLLVAAAAAGTGNESTVAAISVAALVPPLALFASVRALRPTESGPTRRRAAR